MVAVSAPQSPRDVLKSVFGYDEFRPGQQHVIEAVLEGRDCIAVMPTGAGKSLTYQIPARILPGTGLVISPLIALMKDQVDGLTRMGFKATFVNSSLAAEERRTRLLAVRRGEYDLVYVAPEAIEGSLRGFFGECPINLVAVDEAHCISQWGHDFRPAYRRLRGLKSQLGDIPVLALTATATNQVARDIIRELGMVKPAGYKGSFFRSNLQITAVKKQAGGDTRKQILRFVKQRRGVSGIIYCLSRNSVESLTEFLKRNGVRARGYHAGMKDEDRTTVQDAFARDDADVIVATIAFGMGIDKSNVRYVIHRDMPQSIESYYQEIGRAGRDGLPSDCVLFYSYADVMARERMLDGVPPEIADQRRRQVRELLRLAEAPECRHRLLVAYFHQQIESCGESCDICLKRPFEGLLMSGGASIVARNAGGAVPGSLPAEVVFERLRALRRRLADEEGVPAYIIFSDDVLLRLAQEQPRDDTEMLGISGVGPAKLARYGVEFLAALWPDRPPPVAPQLKLDAGVCDHESSTYVVEDDEDLLSAVCRGCNKLMEEHLRRCPSMIQSGERRCRAVVAVDLGFTTCRTHARAGLMARSAAELHTGATANVVPPPANQLRPALAAHIAPSIPAPATVPSRNGTLPAALPTAGVRVRGALLPDTTAAEPPAPAGLRPISATGLPADGRCLHQSKVYQLTADPDRLTLACRDCGHAAFTMIPRCTVESPDGRCPRPVLGGVNSGMSLCSQHGSRR